MAVVGEFGAARQELARKRSGEPDTIVFYGETFTIADEVGAMPLLDFAAAAEAGTSTGEMQGLAAMRQLLQDCLVPEDWPRFHRVSIEQKASDEVLMEVCVAVYGAVSGRPTESPSGLPDGRSTSSPSSNTSASRREQLGLVPVEQVMGLTG